jgi:hypothetical protein
MFYESILLILIFIDSNFVILHINLGIKYVNLGDSNFKDLNQRSKVSEEQTTGVDSQSVTLQASLSSLFPLDPRC